MKSLLNLSHCVKSYEHLCQIYHTTHQIWSCHMTLASIFENFYFSPYSVLNFRKRYLIRGKLAQEQKVTGKKQIGGGPPSVLIWLKCQQIQVKSSHTSWCMSNKDNTTYLCQVVFKQSIHQISWSWPLWRVTCHSNELYGFSFSGKSFNSVAAAMWSAMSLSIQHYHMYIVILIQNIGLGKKNVITHNTSKISRTFSGNSYSSIQFFDMFILINQVIMIKVFINYKSCF